MVCKRNRTPSEYIDYGLYLYFLGLSLRNVVKALSHLHIVNRSHVSIWKWIQKFRPKKTLPTRKKEVSEYILDETILKVDSEYIWLWLAIEPENRLILSQNITQERNMFVAERFMSHLVKAYGKHPVSTDGGTWYPMACQFLNLDHHLHSSYEKSLIERKMQYIKDRTENFDDYFPCHMENCKLNHIKSWLKLFVHMHNKEVMTS